MKRHVPMTSITLDTAVAHAAAPAPRRAVRWHIAVFLAPNTPETNDLSDVDPGGDDDAAARRHGLDLPGITA